MMGLLIRFLPLLATGVWLLLLIVLVARYFITPYRVDFLPTLAGDAHKTRPRTVTVRDAWMCALLSFFVSRALLALFFALSAAVSGTLPALLGDPLSTLTRWDAAHYVGLAENWYVNTGDARFHLVFYPGFPLVLRGFYLVGLDARAAGMLVANVCLLLSLFVLHRLVDAAMGAEDAERSVYFLAFSPFTLFFSIPYSESLFLLLTLCAVYFARKRAFPAALCMGAFASATRMLGLLTAVPIFYEFYLQNRDRKGGPAGAGLAVLKTLPVCAGTLSYLLLNQMVSGNPFQFLIYQSEHWSQRFGSLFNTLSYTLENAFRYQSLELRLGTWIPQALFIVTVILLLALTYRHLSAGDGAYVLLYLYCAVAPTWLLSGCRYLAALYALYPMLSVITRRRTLRLILYALSLLGMAAMTYGFLVPSCVL